MKFKKSIKLIVFICIASAIICFETASETDEKIKATINISEGNMKHKKIQTAKQNYYSTAPGTTTSAISPSAQLNGGINDMVSRNGNLAKTSNVLDVATKTPMSNNGNEIDLGKGPIFFTGWLQYFKFSEEDSRGSTPKSFFKNRFFYEQLKLFPNITLSDTSNDGINTLNTYIKDDSHYYAVLFKDNLNFLSSRHVQLQKTIDILNIDMIRPVSEVEKIGRSNKFNGIQDFGDFSEGFCFKVLLLKQSKDETWIICADTKEEKQKLMEFMRRMKIKSQRDKGLIIEGKKEDDTLSNLLNPNLGASQNLTGDQHGNLGVSFNANTQNITDGYWIVLQSWSQCNLKCGGGVSTLHRMCIPPKNGGAPCEGQAIITKPCNTQPCPDVMTTNPLTPSNNTIVNPPIIKIMPFSTRPQRYSKCVIKESDLMLNEDRVEVSDENNFLTQGNALKNPKILVPVRVIMNNSTLLIFGGENYRSQKKSFSLHDTVFKRSVIHQHCFILEEGKKFAELCPFVGCTDNKMVEEWDYDFHLFKYQCFKPRETIDLEQKLQEKMNEAKKQLLEERENELKRTPDPSLDAEISRTNQVALQAIQKELNLEAMIRKEENEREEQEEIVMLQRIEDEKRKSECLMKAIRERELENQYNIRQKQAQDEISDIKNSAAQQVIIRRSQLKNKIIEMRKKALRRKRSLDQQLMNVRNVVAENMGKAYRKGDCAKCLKAMQCQADKENYCDANFADDYEALQNCKEADDFCVLCSDNEFGEMFISDRHQCYKNCNQVKDINSGRWVWQNEISKMTQNK